jgi:plasmid stabilization system protein ParE
MPRGDKSAYIDKQRRQAEHIEEGYLERGVDRERAEEIAWATVNKQDGGGNESGPGRNSTRSTAAKKGWETRRAKSRR